MRNRRAERLTHRRNNSSKTFLCYFAGLALQTHLWDYVGGRTKPLRLKNVVGFGLSKTCLGKMLDNAAIGFLQINPGCNLQFSADFSIGYIRKIEVKSLLLLYVLAALQKHSVTRRLYF